MRPQGLHWILPALVLSVGLIYYCIWYTAVISTWDWDGIDPNPELVGAENYIRIAQDPIFWKTIQHTIVFFVVTFVLQTALGLIFAVLLHSKVKLAVVWPRPSRRRSSGRSTRRTASSTRCLSSSGLASWPNRGSARRAPRLR